MRTFPSHASHSSVDARSEPEGAGQILSLPQPRGFCCAPHCLGWEVWGPLGRRGAPGVLAGDGILDLRNYTSGEVTPVRVPLPGPARSSQQLHWRGWDMVEPRLAPSRRQPLCLRRPGSQGLHAISAEHPCGRFGAPVSLGAGAFCPWQGCDAQNDPVFNSWKPSVQSA